MEGHKYGNLIYVTYYDSAVNNKTSSAGSATLGIL